MDNANPTTRRSVLQGLPLAAVAASIPLLAGHPVAASTSDAHLFGLVEAWRARYDAIQHSNAALRGPDGDAIGDRMCSRLWALETEIAAVRPSRANQAT